MQRLIFEYSPYYIMVCLMVGVGYAYVLYQANHIWSKRANQVLFLLRSTLVFLLAFLLLGPIIKLITNEYEKPSYVLLVDNSASVGAVLDSTQQNRLSSALNTTLKTMDDAGYSVVWRDLNGNPVSGIQANAVASDLSKAIQTIVNEFEGRNLAGVILVSDGIYNSGASPLYTPVRVPVYTVGIGDTTERVDLILKNMAYNKVAYQGNRFPLKAQVLLQGIDKQEIQVTVSKDGKEISSQQKIAGNRQLIDFDFLIDAADKGMQRYDVAVRPMAGESNQRNNAASVFIEVVEGKKKILLIAPAPHPDIKALRAVVEKNSNYEFIVHMAGLSDANADYLRPGKVELVIFHQAMDAGGKTWALFNTLSKGPSSLLLMLGSQTNFRQLPAMGVPLQFEIRGQWDEVTPVVNSEFRDFSFSENSNGVFVRYPPAQVPFGKFTFPAKAKVLLHQRIGSVTTDRPLLMVWDDEKRKTAVMVGEGVWRWRLGEFADNNNTDAFDELFSKLVQYLSTLDDKSKFRCFPLQNEFSDAGPVVFETQVYNDLFELVYGNAIQLQLRDDKGKTSNYNYTTTPGGSRYRIGGLKEGVYRYKATTTVNNRTEEVNGQFLVKAQNLELQNLTADFQLLRRLAAETGGKFYKHDQLPVLENDLKGTKAASLIHSQESFNPLVNLKWVFFLLLALVSAEWFLRKYLGGY
jgi:hypothetical protein